MLLFVNFFAIQAQPGVDQFHGTLALYFTAFHGPFATNRPDGSVLQGNDSLDRHREHGWAGSRPRKVTVSTAFPAISRTARSQ
jgi:hypothetical protein